MSRIALLAGSALLSGVVRAPKRKPQTVRSPNELYAIDVEEGTVAGIDDEGVVSIISSPRWR